MSDRLPADQPQRDRIEREFDRNLLVEAGAGSGKTHSLARRMAAGIAAGAYQVEHMAAVTFTRKGAAELRGRFQLALEERLRDLQGATLTTTPTFDRVLSPEERAEADARLSSALGNLEGFFAGTIHSFCAHLLRERPVESGVAPGFSELDEAEDARMREESWRDYITRAKASGRPELLELFDAGARAKDLDGAFKTVCLCTDEVDFPPGDPQRPDLAATWQATQQFWAVLQPLLPPRIGRNSKCPVQAKAQEFKRMLRVADPARPGSVVQALELWQGTSLSTTKKWWIGTNGHKADARLSEFRMTTVLPFLVEWRAYVYRLAVTLLLDAREHARTERRRHNTLNYGDLLQMVATVLRGNQAVRLALQQKYRWLFVDEFQDTDPVQAEIILLLAAGEMPIAAEAAAGADWRQVSPRPGALFVVGDPKQSIYRFRRADIDIYTAVKASIVASGGEVVPLTANFRSAGAICDWANAAFQTLLPHSPTQYAPAFERLDAFRQDADPARVGIRTLTAPTSVEERAVTEHEAHSVARYIRTEVDQGRRTLGHFLLLTRKKKPLATYARVLEQYDIPVEVSGAGAFGESDEVQQLAVLLRALADPQDSVSLVGVLRGTFFGISDPELFDHVRAGGRLWLFDGIADPGVDGPQPANSSRVAEALEVLRQMHRWTRLLQPAAAVERILEHTGYLALAATVRGGGEAGDLLHAVDRIRQVADDGGTLMDAVVSLEEDVEDASEVDSLPLEPGRTDVVRLMNLHKAKGLEAEVVFLADPCGGYDPWPDVRVDRGSTRAEGYFKITVKLKSGGSRLVAQPADWDRHEAEEQRYLDAEAHRLLYVAATRAKDLLIVGRWAKAGGRSTRAWRAFDRWLSGAPALDVRATVALPPAVPSDLSQAAFSAASANRAGARASAIAPSWSVTSVTAEARHIARIVRKADGGEDDPTRTISEDTPARRADAGMAWGSLIHGLLEHAMRHKEATRADLERLAMWLSVEHPELRAVLHEAVDTVQRVAAAQFWREALAAQHSVETPFTQTTNDSELIAGVIDLIFQSDAGWQVLDYKTDATLEDDAYREQLTAYVDAVGRIGLKPAVGRIQPVRK